MDGGYGGWFFAVQQENAVKGHGWRRASRKNRGLLSVPNNELAVVTLD